MVKFINKDGDQREVTTKQWEAIFQHVKTNTKVGETDTAKPAKKKAAKVVAEAEDNTEGGEA